MLVKRVCFVVLIAGVVALALVGATGQDSLAQKPDGLAQQETPLTSAAQLKPEMQISPDLSPDRDHYLPAVAYNSKHNQWLVVWHEKRSTDGHRDIWGRRVGGNGQLLSWFNISAGPAPQDRMQPAVAYNATEDEYFVVWMYNPTGVTINDENEIKGRVIAWDGSYMGPERQLIVWVQRSFWTPRVVWNSTRNEYLVTWSANDTIAGQPSDVSHRLTDADGTVLYGANITTSNQPHQPDVTYNAATQEYFLVWRRMWSVGDGDILGARLGGFDGQLISPPGIISVNSAGEDQRLPAVATNGQNRYVVVWEHAYTGPCCDWDIRSQELDVDGNLVGNWLAISQTTDDEAVPAVVARPGSTRDYLAAWQRPTAAGEVVEARRWGDFGASAWDVANVAFWDSENPAVAVGGPGFLIAYEADSTGDPSIYRHIYGRLLALHNTFLPVTRR